MVSDITKHRLTVHDGHRNMNNNVSDIKMHRMRVHDGHRDMSNMVSDVKINRITVHDSDPNINNTVSDIKIHRLKCIALLQVCVSIYTCESGLYKYSTVPGLSWKKMYLPKNVL